MSIVSASCLSALRSWPRGHLPASRAGRILALNAFVSSTGSGLFLAGSVIYFTSVVGLSAVEVGVGLSLASAVGFATTVPIGRLADRFGPREMLIGITLWRATGYLAYLLVDTFWQFLLVACLLYVADRGGPPINQAMVGALFEGPDRSRTMGFVRAVRNVGLTLGFAIAGVALADGSPTAFRLLFIGNAASFVLSSLLLRLLPPTSSGAGRKTPAGPEAEVVPESPPIRNRRYVVLAAVNGVLMLHDTLLIILLPLWIVQHTAAPAWAVTVMLTVNTIMVVLAQVPATRLADTLPKAGRASLLSGSLLALACLVLATSAAINGPVAAVAALLGGTVALTAGELVHSAASWQVSFDLAPAAQQGRYLSFFHLGFAAEEIVGPALALWLVSSIGSGAWAVFAALFVVSGEVARRAVAGRLHEPAARRTGRRPRWT